MPVKPHPQLLSLLMRTTAGATRDIALANILGIKVLPDEYTQSFTCITIVALKSFVLYNVYIGLLRPVRDSITRWWASAAGLGNIETMAPVCWFSSNRLRRIALLLVI